MLWEWAFEEGPVPFCLVWRLPKLLGNSKGLDENRMNSNTIKAHCSPEGLASFVLNTCFLSCYKLLVNFPGFKKIHPDKFCQFGHWFYGEKKFQTFKLPFVLMSLCKMTLEFYFALLTEMDYVSVLGAYHFTASYIIVQVFKVALIKRAQT